MPKRHRHGRALDSSGINPKTNSTSNMRNVIADPNGTREERRAAAKLAKRKATR